MQYILQYNHWHQMSSTANILKHNTEMYQCVEQTACQWLDAVLCFLDILTFQWQQLVWLNLVHNTANDAVLKVLSNILLAIDSCDMDLSAAFNTVDHHILLWHLETSYRLSGLVLRWFETYLIGRRLSVRTRLSGSLPLEILCGVQQGWVLGPILFLLHTADLQPLIEI